MTMNISQLYILSVIFPLLLPGDAMMAESRLASKTSDASRVHAIIFEVVQYLEKGFR